MQTDASGIRDPRRNLLKGRKPNLENFGKKKQTNFRTKLRGEKEERMKEKRGKRRKK